MRTAVIMQPTYLPWPGYFDLMDQSDIFVFLDYVQFDKRSWQQRNRIKSAAGEQMLTVPVFSKGQFSQNIYEVHVDHSSNFIESHLFTCFSCVFSYPHRGLQGIVWETIIKAVEKAATNS